jgi:hypothetical protein
VAFTENSTLAEQIKELRPLFLRLPALGGCPMLQIRRSVDGRSQWGAKELHGYATNLQFAIGRAISNLVSTWFITGLPIRFRRAYKVSKAAISIRLVSIEHG